MSEDGVKDVCTRFVKRKDNPFPIILFPSAATADEIVGYMNKVYDYSVTSS